MNKDKRRLSLLLLAIVCIATAISAYATAISVHASAGSVTDYQKITWGISTGRYYVNGIHAFCAQYNKSWPTVGTAVNEIVPCTNDVLRKALYYGYNGPQNTLGTDDRAHVLTAIAVSDANIGEAATGASAKYDAFYWELVNNPSKYPSPPSNFKAYLAITASDAMQNLAFYEMEEIGISIDILIQKIDAETNENRPQGNAKLSGAQFSVRYYEGICREDVDPATVGATPTRSWVFKTDTQGVVRYTADYLVSGDALYDAVPPGTLVIQETKSSEGYLLDQAVYIRAITSNTDSANASAYNAPVVKEKVIEVHVTKYQADTDLVIPGTVFEHTAPDGSRSTVTTDENGKIVLKGLQYGKHTLWEMSVMDGYAIDESIHAFIIDENTSEHLAIRVDDSPALYELKVLKKDQYDNKLFGAEFTLYGEQECLTEVERGVTDENGILRFSGLETEKRYYLKETKAPDGYEMKKDENGEERVYEIYATSTPVKDEFTCYVDGEVCENITGTKADREVNIEVINDLGYVLPKTGSHATVLMTIAGMAACGMSLYLNQKEKKQKKGEKQS